MFLHGEQLSVKITKIMAEPGARCAVAFWGAGSAKVLEGSGARIICNLQMGGTNPDAIRHLRGVKIKQCNTLHAKVYLGSQSAVVTSANASANGLGLEGVEQAKWQEAGYLTNEIAAIAAWFEKVWDGSFTISDDEWKAAKKVWKDRQTNKPKRPTILSFNVEAEDLPLVTWAGNAPWTVNTENVRAQTALEDEDTIYTRVDTGMEIEGPEDEAILKNKWVLLWPLGRTGLPPKRSRAWWLKMSDQVVTKAFRYDHKDHDQDKVLGAEVVPPEPFNADDALLTLAIRETLMQDAYAAMREVEYKGSFFAPRKDILKPFWKDLQANYARLAADAAGSAESKGA